MEEMSARLEVFFSFRLAVELVRRAFHYMYCAVWTLPGATGKWSCGRMEVVEWRSPTAREIQVEVGTVGR